MLSGSTEPLLLRLNVNGRSSLVVNALCRCRLSLRPRVALQLSTSEILRHLETHGSPASTPDPFKQLAEYWRHREVGWRPVLSLLPPLVKGVLGGVEEVVTLFLAVFSVAIAVGSGLAALIARGRLILWPTLVGAVLIGGFALDLALATRGVVAGAAVGIAEVLAVPLGWRVSVDLAGIAIGGGLFVVPVFYCGYMEMQLAMHESTRGPAR